MLQILSSPYNFHIEAQTLSGRVAAKEGKQFDYAIVAVAKADPYCTWQLTHSFRTREVAEEMLAKVRASETISPALWFENLRRKRVRLAAKALAEAQREYDAAVKYQGARFLGKQ